MCSCRRLVGAQFDLQPDGNQYARKLQTRAKVLFILGRKENEAQSHLSVVDQTGLIENSAPNRRLRVSQALWGTKEQQQFRAKIWPTIAKFCLDNVFWVAHEMIRTMPIRIRLDCDSNLLWKQENHI